MVINANACITLLPNIRLIRDGQRLSWLSFQTVEVQLTLDQEENQIGLLGCHLTFENCTQYRDNMPRFIFFILVSCPPLDNINTVRRYIMALILGKTELKECDANSNKLGIINHSPFPKLSRILQQLSLAKLKKTDLEIKIGSIKYKVTGKKGIFRTHLVRELDKASLKSITRERKVERNSLLSFNE